MTYKKLIRDGIIIFTVVFVFAGIFMIIHGHVLQKRKQAVIITGVASSQGEYFQKKLASANNVFSYIFAGKRLAKEGKYDEAIENFNKALAKSTMTGDAGVAMVCIANAYEKKLDYINAYKWTIKVRDNCPNDWARKPYIERAKYLEYASRGDYDPALTHAHMALKEDQALGPGSTEEEYIDRLNDLKAAESYIRSLKKQQQ
jgi:tetratricopeptide (TPR) repeat protein